MDNPKKECVCKTNDKEKYLSLYKEYISGSELSFQEEEAVRKFFVFLTSKI